MATSTIDSTLDTVVQHEISRHKNAALVAIVHLREMLDQFERDLTRGKMPSYSSTNLMTDLMNRLGQYEAFMHTQKLIASARELAEKEKSK